MTALEHLNGPESGFVVAMLGGFSICWGTTPLRVPRASQRLVAFLALHGRTVKRAAVAGRLWPDATDGRAYSNLRSALSRMETTARKAVAAASSSLVSPRASMLTSATRKRSPIAFSTPP